MAEEASKKEPETRPEIHETTPAQGKSRFWNSASVWRYVKIALSPILAAIAGIVFAEPIKQWWVGPESYRVYVIGNFSNSQDGSGQVRDGFREREGALTIDKVKIEIEARDDHNDPQYAQKLSAELAAADDTLMVVGHMSSTQTRAALPNYLQQAEPPIPVILTTETNPQLLLSEGPEQRDHFGQLLPVFRLSPTDDKQAEAAALFAIQERKAKACWVVEDTSNPVYSKYLAIEFIREVQERGSSVVLWSTNNAVPSVETFKALKTDCVFFSGGWSNSLILIHQVRAMSRSANLPMPTVILTDASVEKSLVTQGGPDVQGVYLVYPLRADESGGGDQGNRLYGRDARAVVESLIEEANRNFKELRGRRGPLSYRVRSLLGMHRISDARQVLIQLMTSKMAGDKRDFMLPGGRKTRFGPGMKNEMARFHVWTIQGDGFRDAWSPPVK